MAEEERKTGSVNPYERQEPTSFCPESWFFVGSLFG